MRYLLLLMMVVLLGCETEKEKMINHFNQLHEEVKRGNLEAFYGYIDSRSQDFVRKLSVEKNLRVEKIKEIGAEYNLNFWCAYYAKRNYAKVKTQENLISFFHYLAIQETPLFSASADFSLVRDKSRIREGKNYVVIAKETMGARSVSWLNYVVEDGVYKLNLIDLLGQEENYLWKLAKQAAVNQYGKVLQKGWREEQLALIHGLEASQEYLQAVEYTKPSFRN